MLRKNDMTDRNEPGPRVRMTAERLLKHIRRDHQPGDRLETIAAMARRFAVSLGTMHKAVVWLVERGWLSSSRRAGTFVAVGPEPRSRKIGLQTSKEMLIFSEAEFYRDFLVGFCGSALSLGMEPRLLPIPHDATATPDDLDGLCGLVTIDVWDPAMLAPIAAKLPVVMCPITADAPGISTVGFDYVPAIETAVRRLVGLGHRRIGFIGLSYMSVDVEIRSPRYDVFVKILERADVEFHLEWATDVRLVEHAASAVERLLALPAARRPSALVVRDMAWPVLYEMVRRGLRPGRDMSVVSLSHAEPWPRWLRCSRLLGDLMPWLYGPSDWLAGLTDVSDAMSHIMPTAVISNSQAMGAAAVAEVRRRVKEPDRPPRRRLVGVEFREGNTIGPPSRQA